MSLINNEDKKVSEIKDNKEGQNKAEVDNAVIAAHEQADKDIEEDADLSIHSPNDDLDEGETARLGDGKNELI